MVRAGIKSDQSTDPAAFLSLIAAGQEAAEVVEMPQQSAVDQAAYVASWLPLHYFKRPLESAIEDASKQRRVVG